MKLRSLRRASVPQPEAAWPPPEIPDMHDMWLRISDNLMDRVTGPLKFRLVLQPLTACIYAIVAGLRDAKTGEPPYFWGLITHPADRTAMIRDGSKSVGKVFVLALIIDIAYQCYVQRFVYPGEAVIVGFILAIVPYLVFGRTGHSRRTTKMTFRRQVLSWNLVLALATDGRTPFGQCQLDSL
jgi:hypothetical protein